MRGVAQVEGPAGINLHHSFESPGPQPLGRRQKVACIEEGGCKATWKKEFNLPWREAGPPNHHNARVDSHQQVVNTELSLCLECKESV